MTYESNNVCPRSSRSGEVDGVVRNAESASERGMTFCGRTNLTNKLVSELGCSVIFSATSSKNAAGVQTVFFFRHVLQILKFVVRWVTVFVIDLKSFWTLANKGKHHDLMNLGVPLARVFAENDVHSFVTTRSRTKYLRLRHYEMASLDEMTDGSNSSAIARFVQTLVTRYCFPRFHAGHNTA